MPGATRPEVMMVGMSLSHQRELGSVDPLISDFLAFITLSQHNSHVLSLHLFPLVPAVLRR
jgi:hypothetical protein